MSKKKRNLKITKTEDPENDRVSVVVEEEPIEEVTEEEPIVESTPKPKRKDYKKTIRFGKDRFSNPRSQRDFETNLRNFLDEEEAYKAWQTWSKGGTVTLVLKK